MKIHLERIAHRGVTRIRLNFERNEAIIAKIKQIKGRKWSQTKRCWHLPYTKVAFEELKAIFGEDLVLPDGKKVLEKNKDENIASTTPSEKIQVLPEHQHRVKVLVPWQRKDWIEKIKSLPDRAWNMEEKYWSVPKKEATLRRLQQWFGKSLQVDATIRWKTSLEKQIAGVFRTAEASDLPAFENTVTPQFIAIERYGQSSKVVTGNQVIVQQKNEKWLMIFVPYDKKGWVEVVKNIIGSKWNTAQKHWELPYVKVTFYALKNHIGLEHCHFNFVIKTNIPDAYNPPVSLTRSDNKRKFGFEQLNALQKDAVTQLKEQLLLERLSHSTLKAYSHHLTGLFLFYKDFHPHDITNKNVQQYLLHQIKFKKIAESTQNQIINAIKAYWERVLKRPKSWIEIPRPKRPKQLPNVLSTAEVLKLIESPKNLKHKLILLLIYSSGLRLGEVTNIRTKDININRQVIHIKVAKGKKDRYVVLAQSVIPYIEKYMKQYQPSHWFFEGQYGGQYSKRSVQSIFHKALEQSKINAYATVHTLRHSYATHCVEAGYNLKFVQEALGHESLKTTERYLHIASEALRKLKSPLDNLDFK